jgi:Spy/CpxP family protein refolding chaperone
MFGNRLIGIGIVALVVVGSATARLSVADEPAKSPAQARGHGFAGSGSRLGLLQLDVVAKDLNLSDEQKESIKKIDAEAQKLWADLRGAPPVEQALKSVAAGHEIDRKIYRLLDERQRARIAEIVIQHLGPLALSSPRIVAKLKFTDEQKEKMEDLSKRRNEAIRDAIKDAGGDRDASREKRARVKKEYNEKWEAVLTPEQREQFDKMQGKKLDLGDAASDSLGTPDRRPTGSDLKLESKNDSK